MNKYQEVKKILRNQEVVQRYLGLPEKQKNSGNWYKSPFRKEKTASFFVSNKGIHDFGDSTHYDIISFMQKYFNTTPYQALGILCNDFGIYLNNEYETKKTIKLLKQKREEERQAKIKIDKWFNKELQEICKEIQVNKKCLKIFEQGSNFEILEILYDEQIKLEYYFKVLFNVNQQDKIDLYLRSI